jgi:hypothetical protein
VRGGSAADTCKRKYSLCVPSLITAEAMGIAGFFVFTLYKTFKTPSYLHCEKEGREETTRSTGGEELQK